ncbi:MAG TPA: ribonuclease P protein component [Xanthobacteraceae bacterium]|nr:ribonuclease P protein component [Xanthobacteraceae bacterium]
MERLKQRADFLAAASDAKASGTIAHVSGFVMQMRARGDNRPARVGFTVSKKVGNAVERNRVRRRLREVVRHAAPDALHPGCDYVLIGRRAAMALPFEKLTEDFDGALTKLSKAPKAQTLQ